MSTLSQSCWHWSGQLRLKINMLPASSSSSSTQMGRKKIVSQNTPLFFQLGSRKCKFGSCESEKKASKRCSNGKTTDLLTSNPGPPQSPEVTAVWCALVTVRQKRRNLASSQGVKGQSCSLACDDAFKSPFAWPSPPSLSGVTPNKPKSWTSGGNSLKSTAGLLNWQQQADS